MAMAYIWTACAVISVVYGILSGNIANVGAGALEGAGAAVKLCAGICGATCLWCGVLEVMTRSGTAARLSKFLSPILRRLLPHTADDREAMEAVSANVTANLLGLGNAATPAGIRAVERMAKSNPASDDLCIFVVLNTASIQLIPATVAAIRQAAGCATPFDILPAVWLTSVVSVVTGLTTARLLRVFFR